MKNQKGITLIALVVTIIVLLILAGVAIAMLSGNNGILSRASSSSKENAIASAKEQIALEVNEAITEYYRDSYVDSNVTIQNDGIQVAVVSHLRDESQITSTSFDQITYTKPEATTKDNTAEVTFKIKYNPDGSEITGKIAKNGKLSWE